MQQARQQQTMLVLGIAATLLGASSPARADDAAVEVSRGRVPGPIMLGVSVTGGARQIGGTSSESATGLALDAEVGARLRPAWGVVAVLEADAMARDDYVTYGAWTVGAGVRWDGPVLITAGAGLLSGSSTRLLADYTVESNSMSGATAFVHGIVPLVTVGHARLGVAANFAIKALGEETITGLSVGAAAAW